MCVELKQLQTWFESVTQSYGKVDKRCPKIVQNGYTELTKLTQNSGYRSNKLITQTFKWVNREIKNIKAKFKS